MNNGIAQYAIHPTTNALALAAATSTTAWENFGTGVKLHTSGDNTATDLNTSTSSSIAYSWIAFDYNGNYVDTDKNTNNAAGPGDIDTLPALNLPRVTFASSTSNTSSGMTYYWIAFDYNGTYVDTDAGTAGNLTARVTFASSTSNSNNRHCVNLETLLGGISLGSDSNPTTNTTQDCQDS